MQTVSPTRGDKWEVSLEFLKPLGVDGRGSGTHAMLSLNCFPDPVKYHRGEFTDRSSLHSAHHTSTIYDHSESLCVACSEALC